MATFQTSGLDSLILSTKELAQLPEDVMLDMLAAQGDVVAKAQRRKLGELGIVKTGQLRDSITVDRRLRGKPGKRYLLVVLKGNRRDGKGTNAEVGFVHEFGAPKRHIAAKQWMRLANEESAEASVDAEERVYNAWLERKGL